MVRAPDQAGTARGARPGSSTQGSLRSRVTTSGRAMPGEGSAHPPAASNRVRRLTRAPRTSRTSDSGPRTELCERDKFQDASGSLIVISAHISVPTQADHRQGVRP